MPLGVVGCRFAGSGEGEFGPLFSERKASLYFWDSTYFPAQGHQ